MSIPEQRTQRKRQSHRPPAGIYHAPADRDRLQQSIARVTLEHVRQGLAADWRNLAITYPDAFGLVYQALDETERAECGLIAPTQQLMRRMVQRERERYAALTHH